MPAPHGRPSGQHSRVEYWALLSISIFILLDRGIDFKDIGWGSLTPAMFNRLHVFPIFLVFSVAGPAIDEKQYIYIYIGMHI